MKNIFRHRLLAPKFESCIRLLWELEKNSDKLYYSINLPSSKPIIFFDTVHNSVWARSWQHNNRIPLIVWGHFLWIILLSLAYYISCQKRKFEVYTERSLKKLYVNAEVLKNIKICNQKSVQHANYFQKTIVSVLQVKICNELHVSSVFHSKSSPLSKYESE